MGIQTLSDRGIKASESIMRVDLDVYFEAIQNVYHSFHNPDGTFPLNVAENKLSWNQLKQKLEDIAQNPIPSWVSGYTSTLGAPFYLEAVAAFMSKHLCGTDVNPDNLGVSVGATSVVEVTTFLLGDPGDVAVFPAPCYPVYRQDIGNVGHIERFDLITHQTLQELKNGPSLTVDHLESALHEIDQKGKRFRMLILTNPDNPTGIVYSKDLLDEIADWCIDHRIHCIVNELYGLSLINTSHPAIQDDYTYDLPFESFAQIMAEKKSDYLHLWYALSKDFGISGFRAGMLYTLNKSLIQAFQNLNLSHCMSNHTQWMLGELLRDNHFITDYIQNNQQNLTNSYVEVVRTLRNLSIPYVPARGSLFIWFDLSKFVRTQTQESENILWMEIYKETGILLTPGEGFGHIGKGLFRMVYPFVSKEELKVAMMRFSSFIRKKQESL